jgi:hypothetical protein
VRRRAPALVAALALAGCGSSSTTPPATGPALTPAAGAPATIWAVGDGAAGSPPARALAARIRAAKPDRLIYLGDVYLAGTAKDFDAGYAPVYGALAKRTWPTPGNHDWPNRASGYLPYWTAVRGERIPPWYAVRLAGWEFLGLNSETGHGAGSAQVRWLRRRVASGGTCRIAFWHRPRFSAGTHHGDQPDTAPLWQAVAGRARLVLSGHEHDLQRFRPRDGLVQIVSGAGGYPRYPVDGSDPRLAFADDDNFGAVRLDLRPGSARVRFIATDGSVLDDSTVRCRRSPS